MPLRNRARTLMVRFATGAGLRFSIFECPLSIFESLFLFSNFDPPQKSRQQAACRWLRPWLGLPANRLRDFVRDKRDRCGMWRMFVTFFSHVRKAVLNPRFLLCIARASA